ncbi:MAG: NUDIX hydrolase [Prevotella sp.]|jgi:hypothetical protein
MKDYYKEHARIYVSIDCIVLGFDEGKLKLLVGRRKMSPGKGEWSLYGGFVNEDESLDDCANRVLLELTGMRNIYMRQVGAYGDVNRDPGERVISVAYLTLINVVDYDEKLRLKYGLEWIDVDKLPKLYGDHNKMVQNALAILRRRISNEPLSFHLLPKLFTLTQLQHVHEAVLGHELDKRNFRKRIKQMDFIEKTNQIDRKTSKRGAALYRFNKTLYADDPSFKL